MQKLTLNINKMIKINNDQDYKKVIERLKQLSENTMSHSLISAEMNDLTQVAINYEYKRYDLTQMDNNYQQPNATY